jgi:hypothetical protein
MKITKLVCLFLLIAGFSASIFWHVSAESEKLKSVESEEEDADLPANATIDKEKYMELRNEQLWMLRGFDTAKQDSRTKAITQMEQSEARLAQRREALNQPLAAMWQPLGPAPIPISATTAYACIVR